MKHLLQNLKRNIIVATAGIVLAGTAAIAMTIHYSEPKPLSEEELVRVHNSEQTVVARKIADKWTASVTREYF